MNVIRASKLTVVRLQILPVISLLATTACSRGNPPSWSGDASSETNAAFDALASPADASADAESASEVDAGDPGLLPQTNDKPDASDPAFLARAQLLWSAIALDDPDRAIPAFFPLSAYEQTKAIARPEGDWRRRLIAHYKRDIHTLHLEVASTGVGTSARLVRVEVPEKHARWIEPGDEGNKLGYYRVYGTKLVWSAEGREHESPVSSLISWRGQWYVVHLTGFK